MKSKNIYIIAGPNGSGIIPTLIAKTNNGNIVVKDEGLFKNIIQGME